MQYFLLALVVSFVVALLIVRTSHFHASLSLDHDLDGVQKMHHAAVPRIGGIAVFAGFLVAVLPFGATSDGFRPDAPESRLLLAGLPVFAAGLAEDFTKAVSPKWRLLFALMSGGLAYSLLGSAVTRTAIPGVDAVLAIGFVSALVTVVAVATVVNAVNIIDGFNGLSAVVCGMLFASLAYVALKVGDRYVFNMALAMAGTMVGFLVLNYPFGRLFLGDGGAYFVGFVVAVLAVMLVQRNPAVSPWYAATIFIYPVFEVVFSMYRRRRRMQAATEPDAVHMHTLIYRRVVGPHSPSDLANIKVLRNSMTAPYLWVLAAIAVVPATVWWDRTPVLFAACVIFCVIYVWIYSRIVHFRTPSWMKL
jgi:UDP-N-acetylmuramyl pentapeptide phosphotransferase/UDP-N-acetylglucosamine-1-phosphate transferase